MPVDAFDEMAARKHGAHLGDLGGGKRHERVSVVGRSCVEGNHCAIGNWQSTCAEPRCDWSDIPTVTRAFPETLPLPALHFRQAVENCWISHRVYGVSDEIHAMIDDEKIPT